MAAIPLELLLEFIKALYDHDGRITHAAETVGIGYHHALQLCRRKAVKETLEHIEQRLIDDAEKSLTESMRSLGTKDRQWSVPLMLKTKGKHRGFNEQMPKESGALSAGRYEIEINEVDDWRERR